MASLLRSGVGDSPASLRFRVQFKGLGFLVWVLGFGVQDLGLRL